ncbi:MAG: Crp/Fnr family transcriptional regulator [Bacteroidota bacterium]
MEELLIKRLNSLYQMDEVMTERVRSLTKISEYKSGAFILKEGQVCNKACMVAEGLVRSYYMNDGRDITSRFMEEGSIITSWPSYYTQQPGNEFIEATEDTILLCLNYTDIQKLYSEMPEFNIVGRRQVEHAFYLAEQRTQMLRKHTAEEKYKFFLENHPTLLQRVPLKHIATYLGMNEETLSRIRSRFHRNNS